MNGYFLVSLRDASLGEVQGAFGSSDVSVVRVWEVPRQDSDFIVVEAPSAAHVSEVLDASLEQRRFSIHEIEAVITHEDAEQVSVGDAFHDNLIPSVTPEGLAANTFTDSLDPRLVWCDRCQCFRPVRHRH